MPGGERRLGEVNPHATPGTGDEPDLLLRHALSSHPLNHERSFTSLNCKRLVSFRQPARENGSVDDEHQPHRPRRGPYRTGIRRREQIIGAAIAVFGEYGYAGGSIRTIADRVGVSHATLLQHFGSKEGLLTAVLEEWDRQTVEARLADVSGLGLLPPAARGHGRHI